MESLCLQQDSAVSGKAIMGSQSPSADARPSVRTVISPTRKLPDIHLDIALAVFCGGAIGTAIRYAFAQIPAAGSFHTGTFVANMLACFCYAGLTAYLAGSSRFGARSKEFASRGLGMGVCGGLSTMSTLALEGFTAICDGQAAAGIAYLLVTFVLGLACATAGVWTGTHLAGSPSGDAQTAVSTRSAHSASAAKMESTADPASASHSSATIMGGAR